MSFKSKLTELINGLPDEDEEPTGDEGIREGDGPTDDADTTADGATDDGGDEGIDEDIDESGDDAGDGEDEEDDEDGLPESDVTVEQLRAALVKLGIENERLRTRLAELGGDAALTTDLNADDDLDTEAEEDADQDEVDEEEVDEETAQKDIDAQKDQIAKLKGDG